MSATHAAPNLTRRRILVAAPLLALAAGCSQAVAGPRQLTVYKTRDCTCCLGWVAHMKRAGFSAKVIELDDITPVRERFGVPFELSSCHTGVIGGYVVEGHVPAADVVRLLEERPRAVGLLVPGMPFGAPGMEGPGGRREAFDTLLLLDANGRTRLFARHS